MKNIALFASGSGTNVENILCYFNKRNSLHFPVIISNNANAYVHERAKKLKIPSFTFTKKEFETGESILQILQQYHIDCIVLAGFLLKIPESLLKAFPQHIINIHPALLPKYGGKGMYGHHVHDAVKTAGEKESGITIHYVNENYDAGDIIFQAKCNIEPDDTVDMIAAKVHELEYQYFPKIIEKTFA